MSRLLVRYQKNMKIQLQVRLQSKSAEVDQRKLLLSVWPAKARQPLEMRFWGNGNILSVPLNYF